MKSIDLTSKLLATENLTIVRTNSSTAYFDTESRVLNLPLWKDMTDELESMLSAHEVGHALFTTGDDWINEIKKIESKTEQSVLKGYFNVVEDARIEKLMKRKYPGLRKTFGTGYTQLVERDFFKIKNRDVDSMLLIDRINLYFKIGSLFDVDFSEEEMEYVERVDRAETIEEAIAVAKDLIEFAKKQKSETDQEEEIEDLEFDVRRRQNQNPDEEDEAGRDTGELEEDEEDESIEDLKSETDENLNQSLEQSTDLTTKYFYHEYITTIANDPIIDYKTVLNETNGVENYIPSYHRDRFDAFMIESERVVNYLVKEFEMRKSAQAYRRAQVSKSGSLNLNKLHSYQLTDDIFKRVTTIPNGKNHGMVFLLDWSGSMSNVIESTVKQVINLAMFCRRVNIPFEVYAFSDRHPRGRERNGTFNAEKNANLREELSETKDKNVIFTDGHFSLLNLFSSKMSNADFKKAAFRFSVPPTYYAEYYHLHGTPLNDALLQMLDFIPKYKKSNNIEKLTFITLTDGEGGNLCTSLRYGFSRSIYENGTGARLKAKHFVNDRVTGKSYEVSSFPGKHTETLLRMIKSRYDVTTIGFHLTTSSMHNVIRAYRSHFETPYTQVEIDAIRSGMRKEGFYSLMDTGRDELFVVQDSSTNIIDAELDVDGKASAATIARKFGKMLNNKKHSRILLDRFINHVA